MNSSNAANTKVVHTNIQTSIAFRYVTGGNLFSMPTPGSELLNMWLDHSRQCNLPFEEMVSSVVTPSVIRAAIASMLSQKDSHEMTTMRLVLKYD